MSTELTAFFHVFSKIFTISGITQPLINSTNTRLATLWLVTISLVLVSAVFVLCHYQGQLLSNTGALSTSIDAFQLLSPIACHMILIWESLFTATVTKRMWQSLEIIESFVVRIRGGTMQNKENKSDKKLFHKYWTQFISSQLLPISIELYITLSVSKAEEWQRHWIARTFSFNATRLAALHYILWVEYLASRGAFLTAEVDSIERTMRRNFSAVDPFEKLRQLKLIHLNLWRLTATVNKRFGVFIMTTITNLFLSITIDLYWIYGNFRFGGNPFALRKN